MGEEKNTILKVKKDDEGKRLDAFLSEMYSDVSRSMHQKLIRDGMTLVNDKKQKPSYKVCIGDKIEVEFPEPKALDV